MTAVPAVAHQRSHVLLVLGSARTGSESAFDAWYRDDFPAAVSSLPGVLGVGQYRHDVVDVTHDEFPRLPFDYLAILHLSVDGAEDADDVVSAVVAAHRDSGVAAPPAAWLYFPVSEKAEAVDPRVAGLIIAFANGIPGRENEFREWYATRHIRHALHIPALASGQLFERTQHQSAGAGHADYQVVAIYESRTTAEEFVRTAAEIEPSLLAFPALDLTRFRESSFVPFGVGWP